MDRLSNTNPAHLAGVYKEVAETVGVDNAYKIFCHFKGQQLMFPLKFYSSEYTARQIIEEYDGSNVRDLVRKFGYSESRIRQIIRETKCQKIHCIWYCINVGGNRTFDETEVAWLRELTESNKEKQVPVIVVLTQACPKNKAAEMKNLVERENLDIVKVVPVLAQEMDFDGEYVAKAYGLDKLINIMSEVLPGELQDTLQNIQKANLAAKKKYAQTAVATATAAAFGEGFAPIPFSDAALLVPTQVTMIASITVIFGLEVNKSFLAGFVSSTIGAAGATVLGKTIVSNLLKMIPMVGTGVGGMISGTTAGFLTTALGEAYIKVMELVYKGEMKKEDLYSKSGQSTMTKLFQEELKRNRR